MLNSRELYDRLCTLFPLRWWSDDPWTVMYQAVLVQHTAWSNVEKTSASADLSLSAVSAMSDEELEGAVRPCGFAASKARTIRALCSWYQAVRPEADSLGTDELESRLMPIKGVGRETASVILLYAFRRPVFVLDAYTRQLLERLGFSFSSDSQRLEYLEKGLDGDVSVFGYYHWLILELCKAWCRKKPLCSSCPLRPDCRRGSSEPVSAS